ncbi:hypothetical protein GLOTRDRAFT_50251 [Gloeophyllum trabeum ATCC 11539]|uniref:Uncharacterized protein n=1 Tax=Gloeophyllum trabeum (strain ATCC 11539 / FP-39264 / Madison 617) TaxID=670483 RepID=S7RE44_GLOTA|nr:uncharacterized protein GLOTRDRAFT_50251 [Gloeophyllum trabeum ATCC 11539]EPQ50734.1 hypothetical protein GLOTRDRAFT_50251 [Gloeophyllum trabeum ATCC 11539]
MTSVAGSDSESLEDAPKHASMAVHALSPAQERRLVDNFEERFLDITRAFKKRTLPDATLPTLSSYLEATHTFLSLILQIPPVGRSASLRTTFLLRLTGDVMTSITGYKPDLESLPALLAWMNDLDAGWLTVLRGQAWDPASRRAVNVASAESARPSMNQTERTRLRSLLITGTERMEEWLEDLNTEGEDYTTALERMGLQQGFEDLFLGTLNEMGGLKGNDPEGMTGTC